MNNPFYLQEVPVNAPFCNRAHELEELQSYAQANAKVVLYSQRRYGKTSLIKRVQKNLAKMGAITIYADFFGISSIDEIASRFAKAVFAVTHKNQSLWKKSLSIIKSFRPVLRPDMNGTFTLSVEPSSIGKVGIELLEDTMASISEFIESNKKMLINIALDEFQEIVVLGNALKIEAVMRTHIQQQKASYFFVGSRRRILLGIFNDVQRPFFQSAINYPLAPLPVNELIRFIVEQFTKGGHKCTIEMATRIALIVECHPYYSQKLSFFVFEIANKATEVAIGNALTKLLLSEKPVFEAIIQGLTSQQRLLLQALAMENTKKILATSYMRKHSLGSIGGIQHSLKQLVELDLIENNGEWRVVDPLFALWLRSQKEENII